MLTDYLIPSLLFFGYLAIIIWSFGKLPLFANSTFSRRGLTLLFAIKLLFSISTVLVYTYYYTDRAHADIYKYFDDSKVIYDAIAEHPKTCIKVITGIKYNPDDPELKHVIAPTQHFDKKESGSIEANHRLVIRLHVLLRFFSLGCIYIHTLIFCFLSFIGCVALYRALQPFFEYGQGRVLMVPIFLLPSILFWSSGLLKETLVMLFLGLLVFTAFRVLEFKNIFSNLFFSIVCILFIFLLKPFIAISFLAALYIMATVNFKGYMRIITMLIGVGIILWISYAHNSFLCDGMSSLISKRNEFITLGVDQKAGSLSDTIIRTPGCTEPLRLIPSAAYNIFLQPAIWSKGAFMKIFGVENLLILIFSVVATFYFKRPKRAKLQLSVFCFAFFFLNYALIGITVPIIGALVHYKVFGLLFYLIFLLTIMSLRKFISDLQKLIILDNFLFRAKKFVFR